MTVMKNDKLLDVLITPYVTEKTMGQANKNIHVFKVRMDATKSRISQACELLYGAKPMSVRTMIYKPVAKKNMRGVKTEKRYKKAIVRMEDAVNVDINKRISEEK